MPEVDITRFETMSQMELEQARKALIQSQSTNYAEWSDEALSEMAALMGVMRRKVSGPPKEKKTSSRAKAAPVALDDLV